MTVRGHETASAAFLVTKAKIRDREVTWGKRDLSWLMVSGNVVLHGEEGRLEQLRLGQWNLHVLLLM